MVMPGWRPCLRRIGLMFAMSGLQAMETQRKFSFPRRRESRILIFLILARATFLNESVHPHDYPVEILMVI